MIWQDYNFIIILILMSLIIVLLQMWIESRRRPPTKELITKTLLKCVKCGYSIERDFEPGDFVTMVKNRCPKCGEYMRVEAIYAIELQQYRRKT
ncbi:hypothetical protein J4526_01910 [Desulfurococcaceae archaeon MEX13E-LK6-19]|nr:hypothetical protein J4526_01910 [Desulfurococcaceae archaeon MEX13E-LK6-19]